LKRLLGRADCVIPACSVISITTTIIIKSVPTSADAICRRMTESTGQCIWIDACNFLMEVHLHQLSPMSPGIHFINIISGLATCCHHLRHTHTTSDVSVDCSVYTQSSQPIHSRINLQDTFNSAVLLQLLALPMSLLQPSKGCPLLLLRAVTKRLI